MWRGAPALAGGVRGPLCPPVPPAHCGQAWQGEAWLEGSSQDRAGQEQTIKQLAPGRTPTLAGAFNRKKEEQPQGQAGVGFQLLGKYLPPAVQRGFSLATWVSDNLLNTQHGPWGLEDPQEVVVAFEVICECLGSGWHQW